MEITLENLYVYINWGLKGWGRFRSYRMGERDPRTWRFESAFTTFLLSPRVYVQNKSLATVSWFTNLFFEHLKGTVSLSPFSNSYSYSTDKRRRWKLNTENAGRLKPSYAWLRSVWAWLRPSTICLPVRPLCCWQKSTLHLPEQLPRVAPAHELRPRLRLLRPYRLRS